MKLAGWQFDRIFPGRLAVAGIVLLLFVAVSIATRIGLAVFNRDAAAFVPWVAAGWLSLGIVYDVAVGLIAALPMALLAWLWPDGRAPRLFATVALMMAAAFCAGLAFVAVSEFVFWNEFSSRFNFIAVDYLIYTREVVGNIRESYPMSLVFGGLGVAAALLLATVWRPVARAARRQGVSWRRRTAFIAVWLLAAGTLATVVEATWKEFTPNVEAQQLAGNGIWEFVHAFKVNEIDYDRFYATVPVERAYQVLREEFTEAGNPVDFTGNPTLAIERRVAGAGPEKHLNVVLISVESLSADYMGVFGNPHGLTPRLDRLAADGLLFTHLYATGTRTVRGLEALALSMPPTPGHSVVKRPSNENLYTIGEVFAEKHYEPIYLYGGYGYFDNMRQFFVSNGYTFVDRGAIAAADIHHETIWGVADEDLFTQTLKELDQRHATGQRFFAHVMTTSNHRPYTFPAGRIDLASGSGAHGAVKYTDWAIGDFIERARGKRWFDETLFVIVADHCAAARGKTDLPLERFHIPMIVYAPKVVMPGRVDSIASQIDVAPTILALLNFSYVSRFFGQDILTDGRVHQRAMMANYQTVGYLENNILVELRPQRRVQVVDAETGRPLPPSEKSRHYTEEAIGYYQAAADAFRRGALRQRISLLAPRG